MESNNPASANASASPGSYVANVMSDIENLNRFAGASLVNDRKTMIECFNGFSWRDARVMSHMERYCAADHAERQLIDDVYRVLCPSFDRVQGPSFAAMSLWLKARLHLQHQTTPFSPVRH
ncbi:hypothetical protein, conserved [Babesia ovata]|uniref:ATPTG10-like domain-containing protein n=1 Tax=Babesia ovata TaxID=189622 RepID=A0A2H6KAL1_9APIC|nr:uncharacterized protein BOVATA_015210 [Babesia ovata]GBE60028.1 hypothetical protein, conserved [Babesia ovata]